MYAAVRYSANLWTKPQEVRSYISLVICIFLTHVQLGKKHSAFSRWLSIVSISTLIWFVMVCPLIICFCEKNVFWGKISLVKKTSFFAKQIISDLISLSFETVKKGSRSRFTPDNLFWEDEKIVFRSKKSFSGPPKTNYQT